MYQFSDELDTMYMVGSLAVVLSCFVQYSLLDIML
jgi:hypothetical protein